MKIALRVHGRSRGLGPPVSGRFRTCREIMVTGDGWRVRIRSSLSAVLWIYCKNRSFRRNLFQIPLLGFPEWLAFSESVYSVSFASVRGLEKWLAVSLRSAVVKGLEKWLAVSLCSAVVRGLVGSTLCSLRFLL